MVFGIRGLAAALELSNTLDASFCIEALQEALERFPAPQIMNTDQGSQFTSEGFTSLLLAHGVKISTSDTTTRSARIAGCLSKPRNPGWLQTALAAR